MVPVAEKGIRGDDSAARLVPAKPQAAGPEKSTLAPARLPEAADRDTGRGR